MKGIIAGLGIGTLAFAAACSEQGNVVAPDGASQATAMAVATVTYGGNGFDYDGTTYNLEDERCGLTGQKSADDGGTGQFADWNGEGQPYEAGQGYLVWVLTLNATPTGGVQLHLPSDTVSMVQVGGTWKFASGYHSYASLTEAPVTATFDDTNLRANVVRNARLVVSHGCAPFEGEGAWCSPGYWRNASDAAWALTGYDKTDPFNGNVTPNFYDTESAADPTLIQVLTTPGANTFGSASDPYGLNAFNATGAFLTDQLDGFSFDPARIGQEDACPVDNHGNFK